MDTADRAVRFWLQAEVDQKAVGILEDFGKKLAGVQAAVGNVATSTAAAVSAATTAATTKIATETAASNAAVAQAAATAMEASTRSSAASTARTLGEVTQSLQAAYDRREAIMRDRAAKEAAIEAEALRVKEEAALRYAKVWEKVQAQIQAGNVPDDDLGEELVAAGEAALAAKQKFDQIEEDKTKKLERETAKREAATLKAVEAEIKSLEAKAAKAEELAEKEIEANKRRGEAAVQSWNAAASSVVNNLTELGESTMRFARGLTHIGLVGERDLGKVTDALLKMQGVVDVFSGIARSATKLDEIYQGLRKATLAQAAAQELLNAANATGAATGAAAAGVSMKGRLVGAGIGLAESAAGGLVGGAAAVGVTSGAGAAVGAGAVATLAGAAVSAAAALFGVVGAVASVREAIKNGIGGGATAGGYVETVGSASWNPFSRGMRQNSFGDTVRGFLDPYGVFGKTSTEKADETQDKRISRSEKILKENYADIEKYNAALEQTVSIQARLFAMQQASKATAMELLEPEKKRAAIADEIARLSAFEKQGNAVARDEMLRWLERRLSNEREIASIKRQAAEEELRASKQSLADVERRMEMETRRIDALKDSQRSAAERFGLMSDVEKEQIVDIKKRLDAGDQTLTGAEVQRLRGFSGTTDREIERFAQRSAAAGGFGQLFGREQAKDLAAEQAELAKLEKLRNQLTVEVKQKTDVVVKIDEDIKELAKRISAEIDQVNKARMDQIAIEVAEVRDRMNKIDSGIKNRTALLGRARP